jgi:hypothetical protein
MEPDFHVTAIGTPIAMDGKRVESALFMITPPASVTPTGHSDVLAAIQVASRKTGLDFDYLLNTAMRESSLNSQAKSKNSSAVGLFQFIDQTWLGLVKQFGERYGLGAYAGAIQQTDDGKYMVASADTRAAILALRQDPQVSACMAGENAKQTKQSLECALGREVCGGELYAAHFLGPSGARRLIQLNENDPRGRADVAFPQAAKANRSMFYRADGTSKSVSELYSAIVNQPSPQPPTHMPSPHNPMESAAMTSSAGAKDAADIMSVFSEPLPLRARVLASTADTNDLQSTPLDFYRGRTDVARVQTPVEIRSLPQSPMVLSPGIVEILALLSPVKMSVSA